MVAMAPALEGLQEAGDFNDAYSLASGSSAKKHRLSADIDSLAKVPTVKADFLQLKVRCCKTCLHRAGLSQVSLD